MPEIALKVFTSITDKIEAILAAIVSVNILLKVNNKKEILEDEIHDNILKSNSKNKCTTNWK